MREFVPILSSLLFRPLRPTVDFIHHVSTNRIDYAIYCRVSVIKLRISDEVAYFTRSVERYLKRKSFAPKSPCDEQNQVETAVPSSCVILEQILPQ